MVYTPIESCKSRVSFDSRYGIWDSFPVAFCAKEEIQLYIYTYTVCYISIYLIQTYSNIILVYILSISYCIVYSNILI